MRENIFISMLMFRLYIIGDTGRSKIIVRIEYIKRDKLQPCSYLATINLTFSFFFSFKAFYVSIYTSYTKCTYGVKLAIINHRIAAKHKSSITVVWVSSSMMSYIGCHHIWQLLAKATANRFVDKSRIIHRRFYPANVFNRQTFLEETFTDKNYSLFGSSNCN